MLGRSFVGWPVVRSGARAEGNVPDLTLKLAITAYDHVRDLVGGSVRVEGITFDTGHLEVEEIFYRQGTATEWDISEFSMGKYLSFVGHGDRRLQGLPIFVSRVFRHSAIYVRRDGPIRRPEDLVGRRIGVPDWTQTAVIYGRGILQDEHGVRLEDVHWFVGNVSGEGAGQDRPLHLPERVRVTRVTGASLAAMLAAGDLDAIIFAREPSGFFHADSPIVRLLPDRAVEVASYKRTGVYPIMHTLVVRRALIDAHPWIVRRLHEGFEQAKRNSLARLRSTNVAWLPLPWLPHLAAECDAIFDGDPWPYGVAPNRRTLEAFLRYGFEQGVTDRLVTIDDLFPPDILALIG